jgi:outer membrane protein insertion porin family
VKKFRETVYSIPGRIGLARPYGGRDTLPISERFFGGGSRDLRGFGFEEAGPKDTVTGRPIGGNGLVVINHELRFPIYGAFGGTVFSDIGNVYRRVKDISPRLTTVSLGIGFRIKTPIGPVRFDIGTLVLNKPQGAPRVKGHFSFGQTF